MKNVFTISPEQSFLDVLAAGLWERAGHDSAKLAAMRIFLPTRRACRSLRDSFLSLMEGNATLLPRMQPLGDLDDDELLFADVGFGEIPPAIAPLRRRLLLAELIQKRDTTMPVDQAVHLAEALALFLDEAQINRCDFGKLPGLVRQRELAEHWQQTVAFLDILTKAWPEILAGEGCIDPAERRNRVLAAQADAWLAKPPAYPVIAAGSTGTMPATADFLNVIAGLPQGAVVLPGLDGGMDEEMWQAVDDTHPQHGMKNLLHRMQVKREDVKPWHGAAQDSLRTRLIREAMRPASVTDAWRDLRAEKIPAAALHNLTRVTFAHPQEEAQAIALMLRQALDEPLQQVALVTPDRNLAERVAALLPRWGIEANDSAGSSLAAQPIGSYLTGILAAATPDAGAISWLSFLKHPLAACGLATVECRTRARHVELTHWRRDLPEPSAWLDEVKTMLQPLTAAWNTPRPLAEWLQDHLRLAENAAATDNESGADRLWRGEVGAVAGAWLDDMQNAAASITRVNGAEYASLFSELLRQAPYRPSYGLHPRLSILGPLEARLLRPDFVVLGGMNEGVWPPEVAVDPWMSRPMKKDFGLPPPEYRIGLSAHDFVQLLGAPKVVMTRALRSGSAPTVPSRFLLSLKTVLRALGHSDDRCDALAAHEPWQAWARMLDEPLPEQIKPVAPPEPRPPLALRPKKLSVTEIGTWQRNPYAIYAKHILSLRKLDPLEAEIDASDRGNLIHKILEKFTREYQGHLPPDALGKLLQTGRVLFAAYDEHPEVKAFWWPKFQRIAAWFIAEEAERRAAGIRLLQVEATGEVALNGLVLKGRADRIDKTPDGNLVIIDYKTGGVPTKGEVESGIEPQLPLLAMIAERGGFTGIPAGKSGSVAYWHLVGGQDDDSNKIISFEENLAKLIAEAELGLTNLIAAFADEGTAYHAVPKPSRAPRYDDYAHLARLAEWGRTTEESV